MGATRKRGPAIVPAQPLCCRKDCDQPGVYIVGFTFQSIFGGTPARATTGLRVCRQHRDDMKFEDVFPPESIEMIQNGVAAINKAPADPASFRLTFERGN